MIDIIKNFAQNDPELFATVILVSCLIFFESILPLKKYSIFSRENLESVFWLSFNKVLERLFIGLMLVYVSDLASREFNPFSLNLEPIPLFFQFMIFFIGNDFLSYITHRFLHHNNFLWKLHQLHHSSQELTIWSSFRHHWFEVIYYGVTTTLFASFFILDPQVKILVFILISTACYVQHANINWRFIPSLDKMFITPLNHRWHHSAHPKISKGQNFGLFLSIWDQLFHSYFVPKEEPVFMGAGEDYPKKIWKRLVYPLVK